VEYRLLLHILAVAVLVAASLTAMADQSGRLVGVHEVPPFVLERVDIVPAGVGPGGAHSAHAEKSALVRTSTDG
jgi:hypothetical protein